MVKSELSSPEFELKVSGVTGRCPAGEAWAKQNIEDGKIPVFACEGPCVRGEIARVAADIVGEQDGYARACFAEAFLVPHSTMTRWLKDADEVVMVDGCFLKCLGRVMENLVDAEKIRQFDTLKIHKKYGDLFKVSDVPANELHETASDVAETILAELKAA